MLVSNRPIKIINTLILTEYSLNCEELESNIIFVDERIIE